MAEFVEQAVYLADRISFDQGVLSRQLIDQYSAALSSALSDLSEIQGTTRYDDDSETFVIGLPGLTICDITHRCAFKSVAESV